MPAKDREPHTDNPATENLGKTTPADEGDKKKTPPRKRQSSTASPTGPTDLPARGDTNAASGAGELRLVPIKQLVLDKDLQSRVKIDKGVVENYIEEMQRREFPPLRAVFDGKTYWVWDGAHRLLAAQARGAKKVQVLVTLGTRDDALWLAVSANQDHGLQRTNADKQKAVDAALDHPNAKQLSVREIAKHVGVSHQTVSNRRKARQGAKPVSKFDSTAARTANEKSKQTTPEQQRQTESVPLAVPNGEQKKGHGAAPSPAGNDPSGLSPDDKGGVKAGEQSMADHGDPDDVSDDAKAETGELLHTREAANRLLELSDQIRAELLALPKAERDPISRVLGLIEERARRILKELSKADYDLGGEDTD